MYARGLLEASRSSDGSIAVPAACGWLTSGTKRASTFSPTTTLGTLTRGNARNETFAVAQKFEQVLWHERDDVLAKVQRN